MYIGAKYIYMQTCYTQKYMISYTAHMYGGLAGKDVIFAPNLVTL